MTQTLREQVRVERHAQLVWFDPGVTTGIVVVSIRPAWLRGDGEPTWSGLRRALTMAWFGQVGRNGKIWDTATEHSRTSHAAVRRTVGRPSGRPGNHGRSTAPNDYLANEIAQVGLCVAVLDLWPDAAWGYEDFVPQQANASREFLAPVRIFSRLEALEIMHGEKSRTPFVQAAGIAKTTATDDRMHAAGLYRAGMPHATDAARHAAVFMRRCRANPMLRAAAWPKLFCTTEKESA